MKKRLILVAIIILAQLGFLGVHYFLMKSELDTAPHIIVKGQKGYESFTLHDSLTEIYLTADDPHFGKSLWWKAPDPAQADSAGERVAPPCTPRNAPGDDVQGAVELALSNYSVYLKKNGEDSQDNILSVIWEKKADGLWDYRLEAPGSSEDVAPEGGYRTQGRFFFAEPQGCKDGSTAIRLRINPICDPNNPHDIPRYHYSEPTDSRGLFMADVICEEGGVPETKPNPINITLEIALRQARPALITQVYINGAPLAEFMADFFRNLIPIPAEALAPEPIIVRSSDADEEDDDNDADCPEVYPIPMQEAQANTDSAAEPATPAAPEDPAEPGTPAPEEQAAP